MKSTARFAMSSSIVTMRSLVRGPVSLHTCFPDLAKARIDCCVVSIGGFAVQDAAWSVLLAKFGVLWIIRKLRLFLGVQVVKIAIELIEAMHRRQELVAVTKMIFAKLSRRVAERLEQSSNRRVFFL